MIEGVDVQPFTDEELDYLGSQRLARIATSSASGLPDVAVAGFGVEDDAIVSGGVKVRGQASLEAHDDGLRIRIVPEVIWSWGINEGREKRFASIEKRIVTP